MKSCACRRCPSCGGKRTGQHPEDGIAYCPRCGDEWWATCGPLMNGKHPRSQAEQVAWDLYDVAVYEGRIQHGAEP